jgi:glyoxylase-like metal-dependent hydrolase (beta-lactamase superfamily II)
MRSRAISLVIAQLTVAATSCAHAPAGPARTAAEERIAPDLTVATIADRAYLVTHERPWPANALLVEMTDGTLVLVNTTYRPEAAEALLRWVDRRFGRRPMVAIDTHFHADVLGGNEALIRRGVPVYGSDATVVALRERGERFRALMLEWLAGDVAQTRIWREATFVPPDHVFPAEKGLTLAFDGQNVHVLFPGPAHAPDNVVVFFPREGILFAGCLAIFGPRLGNLSDADVGAWPAAVRRVAELGAKIVVPGHGRPGGPELLANTLEVLGREAR